MKKKIIITLLSVLMTIICAVAVFSIYEGVANNRGPITAIKEYVSGEDNSETADLRAQVQILTSNLNETQEKLTEKESELETIIAQRTALLNSITEIDNKINSTTDSTELENLQDKKNAILLEIDSLNNEISILTEEKEALNAKITELEKQVEVLQSGFSGNVIVYENELEIIPMSSLLDCYIYNSGFSFRYNKDKFSQVMNGEDLVDGATCNNKYTIEVDSSLKSICNFFVRGKFNSSEYYYVDGYSLNYVLYDFNGNELDLTSCPDGLNLKFERIHKVIDSGNSVINVYAYLSEDCSLFLSNFGQVDLTTLTGTYVCNSFVIDFDNLTFSINNSIENIQVFKDYILIENETGVWAENLYTVYLSESDNLYVFIYPQIYVFTNSNLT